MRFLIPLLSALLLLAQPAVAAELYDITFAAPVHQAGQLPAVGNGPSRISSIQFGSPRVVNNQPLLSGNCLEFEAYTSYEQIELDLGGVSGAITLDFDVVTANLLDSLYAFAIFIDTPEVRTLDFHGPLRQLYAFKPFGGGVLMSYADNRKYHIRMTADGIANQWTISVDGVEMYRSTLDATTFSSIRFGMAPAYAGAESNPAIKAWVDNIKVVHTPGIPLVPAFWADSEARSATLKAWVNPQGRQTTVTFSYTDPSGATVSPPPTVILAGSTSETLISAKIGDLKPHTFYRTKVVATSAVGTTTVESSFTSLNTPPIATPDELHTPSATQPFLITVLANDSEPDGDPVTVQLPGAGETGFDSRVITDGTSLTFHPDAGFDGNASFVYRLVDDFGGSATGTVVLRNAAPAAENTRILLADAANAGTATLAVHDPDGDALVISLLDAPQYGAASIADGVVTYDAGPGFTGFDRFSYSATDGRGGSVTASVFVLPSTTVQKIWHATDKPIPGSAAVWKRFGAPTILPSGMAGWRASFVTLPGRFDGIFSGELERPELRYRTGLPAIGPGGYVLGKALIAQIDDPVFAGPNFAFRGRMAPVAEDRDTAIWIHYAGSPRLLAREGDVAHGNLTGRFKTLQSLAMPAEDTVFFTAELDTGSRGLWVWSRLNNSSQVLRVLRDGQPLHDPKTLKRIGTISSFRVLSNVPGSPGHGRYDSSVPSLDALVKLNTGAQAIITVRYDGVIKMIQRTGVADPQGKVFTALGPPSSPGNGDLPVAAVTYTRPQAKENARRGIVNFETGSVLANAGSFAPGLEEIPFNDFRDPVAGLDANGNTIVAFQASLLKRQADENVGIWWGHASEAVSLVAIEGSPAPGAEDKKFRDFTSLAIMNGYGPVFTATLAPGDNTGCWATDSAGGLRLILKTGDQIGDKKVRSFDVLGTVRGSQGQGRSMAAVNGGAAVIFRVNFTDRAQGIVTASVP